MDCYPIQGFIVSKSLMIENVAADSMDKVLDGAEAL